MSSTSRRHLTSEEAVDGDETTCAWIFEELNSWWTIDLLDVYKISAIYITGSYRFYDSSITGAQILIGNSRDNNYTTNSL